MRARWWTTAAAVALVVAGCSTTDLSGDGPIEPGSTPTLSSTNAAIAAGALLAEHGLADLAGQDVVSVLAGIESLPAHERPADLLVQVRDDSVLITDGRTEAELELPGDQSYVAVAPYVEHTHDCVLHSVTTCEGELVDTEVDVTVRDAAGAVVLQTRTSTQPNGFAGLWLPRGLAGTVEMSVAGLSGEVAVETTPGAATCVTGLRLT